MIGMIFGKLGNWSSFVFSGNCNWWSLIEGYFCIDMFIECVDMSSVNNSFCCVVLFLDGVVVGGFEEFVDVCYFFLLSFCIGEDV